LGYAECLTVDPNCNSKITIPAIIESLNGSIGMRGSEARYQYLLCRQRDDRALRRVKGPIEWNWNKLLLNIPGL
jgi:hypothetical protein